jgi:hypothetical protein
MVRMDDSGGVTKCWLDQDELQLLEEVAARTDWKHEIAMQLMGRYSLRADEVNYPGDAELRWSENAGGWLLEVRGKNTAGGNPKVRDAWMPEQIEANVRRFSRERERETDQSWVQVSKSTARRWVKEAAAEGRIGESTGSSRWRARRCTT